MDVDRKCIIKSILRFLRDEIDGNRLDGEQKEGIDVACQCLENTYDIAAEAIDDDVVDLRTLFRARKEDVKLTEDVINKAEAHKSSGNYFMKTNQYAEALEEYNKAIEMNPGNAVYYCNRAAAHSRLERHRDAMADCKRAIRLDPGYGKAYGRLGIAHSNMYMFKEAKEAYTRALELDPNNATYEENLRLAEERLLQNADGAQQQQSASSAAASSPMFDFNRMINNPALLSMASQMLTDPAFREIGQQFAQQMQSSNPDLIENLRQSFGIQRTEGDGSTDCSEEKDGKKD